MCFFLPGLLGDLVVDLVGCLGLGLLKIISYTTTARWLFAITESQRSDQSSPRAKIRSIKIICSSVDQVSLAIEVCQAIVDSLNWIAQPTDLWKAPVKQ